MGSSIPAPPAIVILVIAIHPNPTYQMSSTGHTVGKNSLIMNNPDLMLRKSILTKNDAITQHR
jgi:hypothetical protein